MSIASVAPGVHRFSIPASSFGIILGMAGLSSCWRYANILWDVHGIFGELLTALTVALWGVLLFGFVMKWLFDRDAAMTEFRHPVDCCFIGLVPVSTLLIGALVFPWSNPTSTALIFAGAAGQLAFSMYRSGGMLRGARKEEATTAVMYLPTVAGNFVSAIALSRVGYVDAAKLFFGAGVFSWLALESVITHRLYIAEPLPHAVRPTLGVQFAPPAVAAVAYLAVSNNSVDMFFMALFGYALLQLLLLVRLSLWFAETGFTPSYWSFSFGATSLVLASMHSAKLQAHPVIDMLALPLFAVMNVALMALFFATVRLLLLGRLFVKG